MTAPHFPIFVVHFLRRAGNIEEEEEEKVFFASTKQREEKGSRKVNGRMWEGRKRKIYGSHFIRTDFWARKDQPNLCEAYERTLFWFLMLCSDAIPVCM